MESAHREIVESALEYLEKYVSLLPELVKELRDGKTDSLAEVGNAIEGVAWVSRTVERLHAIGAINEDEVAADFEKISDAIAEVISALENKDYVLIADIFEYEFLEYAKKCNARLNSYIPQ